MKTLLPLIVLGAALAVTSCSTVSGFGQDLQKGGAALERKALKNSP